MNNAPVYKLRLARTLYNNFFRARLQDANGEDAGQLFEEGVSRAVLSKFTTETTSFNHCEFYYPSPAFYFAQEEE